MIEYTLGIDIGTSGVKAGLLNLNTMKLEYIAMRTYDSANLQETEVIWEKTVEVIRESSNNLGNAVIKSIGLSGQMHGIVLYDSFGKVIGPLINWQDGRCNEPLKKYNDKNTLEIMMEILGGKDFEDLGIDVMASGFFGATLFHIKDNEPELFNSIKHAVLPADFIREKMLCTKYYSTDQTNAFSTGLFNTRLNKWHSEFIEKLGLPVKLFPEVRNTSDIAGYLPEKTAEILSLQKGIPVVFGGGDNQMSILGSGLLKEGSPLLINIGTGAQISKVISEYTKYSGVDTRSYFEGLFALVGAGVGGGRNYEWLKEEIFITDGTKITYKEMDKLASEVEPGAEGLNFRMKSRRNINQTTGFYGNMEVIHSIGHKARAVMEGVLTGLYQLSPALLKEDKNKFLVGAGKGLQKSKVWSQIAADFFGKSLKLTDFENAVWGAAVMAAKGSGAIDNLENAVSKIEYRQEILPDPVNFKKYEKIRNHIS
jgi:xylulokinase